MRWSILLVPVWCTRDPGTSLSTGERAGQFSSVEGTGETLPRQLDEPYLLDLASATTVASPLSLLIGLSRGKVVTFLSGSVPTEKCMGNCRRAVRVPCTSSGFRQLPRNRRENTLGLHTIPLLRPAGSAPSRCQSHGSRVYMYSIRY